MIVPHGPLFSLSFAALVDAGGQYLVERYEIGYAPSLSALEAGATSPRSVGGAWLLVGSPATLPLLNDRPLPPLPATSRELSAIAAVAPDRQVERLEGSRARVDEFRAALDRTRPGVVHVATHGLVYDDPKKTSFLAFDAGPASPGGGRLTVDDIYGLRIPSDLVVLSACRTGAGQVTGDGVVGFTRAFFAAGARSVVSSFWDVADEATSLLMPHFYREYVQSGRKSRSLGAAQRALLADLRAGRATISAGDRRVALPEHPLLWAGFFLTGQP